MKKVLYAFLVIAVFFLSCAEEQQENTATIAGLKATPANAPGKSFNNKPDIEYTVQGYFVKGAVPMIVTDMKWVLINTPMPDSVFLPIDVNGFSETSLSIPDGSQVKISVKRDTSFKPAMMPGQKIAFKADFVLTRKITVLREPAESLLKLSPVNTQENNTPSPQKKRENKFALLYSGGISPANAAKRYWNDLVFMYQTLKDRLGYDDDQIIVVYKDGYVENGSHEMPVHFAASMQGVDAAFAMLETQLNANTNLFVFVSNHGGGYNVAEQRIYSAVKDVTPFDETDAYKFDETLFYYNEYDNIISDDDFAARINRLRCKQLVGVFGQCFSGGLLRDLRGPNHILMSASGEFEFSWGTAADGYDIFNYYFTVAIGNRASGVDTDHDGKISMLEAFMFAVSRDTAPETPLLESDGDGEGISGSKVTSAAGDGKLASRTFL